MPGGGASVFEVEHHHLAVLHREQVDEADEVSPYYGQWPRERRGEAPRAERPERLLLPKPSEVLQFLDAMVRQAVDPHNGGRPRGRALGSRSRNAGPASRR